MDYTGVDVGLKWETPFPNAPTEMLPTSNPATFDIFRWNINLDSLCELRVIGSSLTMQIDSVLCSISQNVRVESQDEIKKYLIDYSELIYWIDRICNDAVLEFKPSASLILQLYKDPEIDFKYLCLLIRQQNYQDDLMSKIESFQQRYDNALTQLSGSILVTTDFQPIQA